MVVGEGLKGMLVLVSVGAITPYNLSHVDTQPPNAAQEALRFLAYHSKRRQPPALECEPFLFTHPQVVQIEPQRVPGYEGMRYYLLCKAQLFLLEPTANTCK